MLKKQTKGLEIGLVNSISGHGDNYEFQGNLAYGTKFADGSDDADEKLERVLTCDPGIGVMRHADAGYPDAIATAEREGLRIPMREEGAC